MPVRRERFHAVIFDMDGTMLDTEILGKRAWDEAAVELQIELPADYYRRLLGQTTRDNRVVLREMLGTGAAIERLIQRAHEIYQNLIENTVPEKKAGLDDLLGWLQESGMPLAVATSTRNPWATYKLEKTGLRRHFRAILTGDQITHGKPAPDIYLLAAGTLGIAPEHCLAIEDSPAGTRSAHAAGMWVALVPDLVNPSPEIAALAGRIFGDLREVHDWLDTRDDENLDPCAFLAQA